MKHFSVSNMSLIESMCTFLLCVFSFLCYFVWRVLVRFDLTFSSWFFSRSLVEGEKFCVYMRDHGFLLGRKVKVFWDDQIYQKGRKKMHRVKTKMDCPILGPVLPKTFFFSLPLLCSSLYCRGANCSRDISQASLLVDLQLDFTYEKNQWKIECPLMCVGQHCWQQVNLPTWNQLYQTL